MSSTLARVFVFFFFFCVPATAAIYTLSLHDALPISNRSAPCLGQSVIRMRERGHGSGRAACKRVPGAGRVSSRSEEHTSELQSLRHLVCRLLLEKKKKNKKK